MPNPGWTRVLQQTGSGEDAVIQKVTWTGGHVPTGEDSLFQFLGQPAKAGTYTFQVQQTYSDNEIVNWSDPESGANPAPTIEAKASLGGGGTPLLTIVALVVGAVGVDPRRRRARLAAVAAGRGSSHDDAGAGRPGARVVAVVGAGRCRPRASAHAYLTKTFPVASAVLDAPPPDVALTFDEAVEPRFAIISVTDKDAPPGDDRARCSRSAGEPGHAGRAARAAPAGGLVPRLLAGDLGRRPPGAGCVHLRGRPERRGRRRSS